MPACAATIPKSSSLRSSKAMIWSSTSSAVTSLCAGSFFLLISWMTPMTSSRWLMSGTVSIDLVR